MSPGRRCGCTSRRVRRRRPCRRSTDSGRMPRPRRCRRSGSCSGPSRSATTRLSPAGTVISADQPSRRRRSRSATTVNLVVATGRVTIIDVTGYTDRCRHARARRPGVAAARRHAAGSGLHRRTDPPVVTTQSLAPGDVPMHSTSPSPTAPVRDRTAASVTGVDQRARSAGERRAARRGIRESDRLEPVAEQPVAALGQHRLGVELHADDRRRCGARCP